MCDFESADKKIILNRFDYIIRKRIFNNNLSMKEIDFERNWFPIEDTFIEMVCEMIENYKESKIKPE
jgi:hypothetical protein